MEKVFIAHSSEDHKFVFDLAEKLKSDGIDVWIDDWEIKVGDSIVQKINEGLEQSSFLIIVFSEYSIKSDWVSRELNSTLMRQLTQKDVKILPIFLNIKPEEVPPLFRDMYGVKFNRSYLNEAEYKKLIEPIKELQKADELARYQDRFYDNIVHIDIILDRRQPTRQEVEFILNLIREKQYREYFFSRISTLNWFAILEKEGYFKPQEETKRQESERKGHFQIPHWSILPYLEKVSQQVNSPQGEIYINKLLNIIQEVTKYHLDHNKILDNYYTWYYFAKILYNLPNDRIPVEIIDCVPVWLDSNFDTMLPGEEIATKLLPKFLTDNPEDIKKAEKIIAYITEIKTYKTMEEKANLGKSEKRELVVDSYYLKEVFDKYSEVIGTKCSKHVIDDLSQKIKTLLKNKEDGTYRSFYDEYDYLLSDPLEMLTYILKRVLISKAKNNVDETKEILKEFLGEEFLYFPKMALFVIGQHMDKYDELFWEKFNTEIGDYILENTLYLGDELKHTLRNFKKLTNERRKILNKKIENAARKYNLKNNAERYIPLIKQEIYNALSHDPYFKTLYDEMKKITKVDAELHPAIGKVETCWGFGPPPLTKEQVLDMSNNQLAKFLGTFKTVNFWEGPTVNGLAELLYDIAKAKPEKFVSDLIPFKNVGYLYIYKILSGIREAWNNKKSINWAKLFKFIKQYIGREEFWEDKFIVEADDLGANYQWIVSISADLIRDGTKDDNWAFPEEYFEDAEEIIYILLNRSKAEAEKDIRDYVTYTINTSLGRVLEAYISFALRIARVNDKRVIKKAIERLSKFKENYEKILNNKIIEGYTLFGLYLSNFYYLDKNWTTDKIKYLENEKGTEWWEAFMDGYLFQGKVVERLYSLMKPHYEFSLSYSFKERRTNESLIHHICVAYLYGNEGLDDQESLFRKIINKWDSQQIKEIIDFFWMQRNYLIEGSEESEKKREKIIEFWRLLYEKYKAKGDDLTDEDKQILSSVSRLTVFLPEINNEFYEWLLLSSAYVDRRFNSPFFIKYLDKLKEKGDSKETAKYIGQIFLKMLENFEPNYPDMNIRSIVEFLYKSGAYEEANEICNKYGLAGITFLKDIYDKYSNL